MDLHEIAETLLAQRAQHREPQASMIETLAEHFLGEYLDDLDRTMRPMRKDGVSRSWGPGSTVTGRRKTWSETRRHYLTTMSNPGYTKTLDIELDRVVVGLDSIALDGVMSGAVDPASGKGPSGDRSTPARRFRCRIALFFSFADGLIVGQDVYLTERETIGS